MHVQHIRYLSSAKVLSSGFLRDLFSIKTEQIAVHETFEWSWKSSMLQHQHTQLSKSLKLEPQEGGHFLWIGRLGIW